MTVSALKPACRHIAMAQQIVSMPEFQPGDTVRCPSCNTLVKTRYMRWQLDCPKGVRQ